MAVRILSENSTLTAVLEGEIDHHSAKAMREEIDSAVVRLQPERLCLDFSGIVFMDSSGVGLIMGRHRLMNECGGTVEVKNVPANMLKMIRLAGLGRLGIKGIQ